MPAMPPRGRRDRKNLPRAGVRDEVMGVLVLLAGLLLGISLATHYPDDPSFSTVTTDPRVRNAAGRAGAYISDLFLQVFGLLAHLFPLGLVALGGRAIWCRRWMLLQKTEWGLSVAFLGLAALAGPDGGVIGSAIHATLQHFFATAGRRVVTLFSLLTAALLLVPFSLRDGLAQAQVAWAAARLRRWQTKAATPSHRASAEGLSEAVSIPMDAVEAPTDLVATEEDMPHRLALPAPVATTPPPLHIVTPIQNVATLRTDLEGDYQLPPLALLSDPTGVSAPPTEAEWLARSRLLEQKLLDFDISGRIAEIHPGPVVTMFEFEPAPGIKLNRITTLADDLALAMKATQVRIVAPLPWKSTVGIEIPNVHREAVLLKEILSSQSFVQYHSKTRFALGKDVLGHPVSADLTGMPHLLIAGSTGSGKSVGMNGMILSILFSATPVEVKMLMIDPKMLEFSLYDGIPHLIAPVIVRPKAAAMALRKMVAEMQRRYELLAERGVRNIDAYNRRLQEDAAQSHGDPDADRPPPLPYIIVFIDELADLMMVASRDVEDSITRLAQMARAAGIHLVLATQRPSVDVITGLIKANFPARMAYRVSSKTDSRTILDANGAERLLGQGDMLYLASGTGNLVRIHGAYVSEEEVKKVVRFIKGQAKPAYETPFSEEALASDARSPDEISARDEMYEAARELVISTRQASASFVQRRLRVGYPRAARMIEMMEEDGLVGPATGAKPREVLLPAHLPSDPPP